MEKQLKEFGEKISPLLHLEEMYSDDTKFDLMKWV